MTAWSSRVRSFVCEGPVGSRVRSRLEAERAFSRRHARSSNFPAWYKISTPGSSVTLFQPGHAIARFREPDKHPWIVARNDETRIRRNLLHAILRFLV